MFNFKKKTVINAYLKAIQWIKKNTLPEQGITLSSKRKIPYLEVTGYLIPTLINVGELKLAKQYAEFLSYMQRPNGSFAGPDGKEYPFDTGQALKGLISASKIWPKFKSPAKKAADYLIANISRKGKIKVDYKDINEGVIIYTLPALKQAGQSFKNKKYFKKAQLSVAYYKNHSGVLSVNQLTHFLAYTIDGFMEMGEMQLVKPVVKRIFRQQRKDGSIPAYPKASWVCTPGLAQLAIIAYKMKMREKADKAINYLNDVQNKTGGWFGSYGTNPGYFPNEEISWTNKFFLDAVILKIASFFNEKALIFPKEIENQDPRLKILFREIPSLKNKKILDVGCGKGRFTKKIKAREKSAEVHGVDISPTLLKEVPKTILTRQGSILNLPYKENEFDVVFCIETLEHALDIKKAIKELCRVTKEQGKLIIIDKNIKKLGMLNITDFEQWFDEVKVKKMIEKYLDDIRVEKFHYKNKKDLFILWGGIKKESLNKTKWSQLMTENKKLDTLVNKIKSNNYPVWVKPLLIFTKAGDSVMELGSGTGELSAILNIYGRETYLLDYSRKNIEFAKKLFKKIKLKGKFFVADVLKKNPLRSNSVDWVFSSGLLEHFLDQQIVEIIKEAKRVAKKGVISLVPNANALFYRIGKFKQEKEGNWQYGQENPKFTLKPHFKKAGLVNLKEYSVGNFQALKFYNQNTQIKDIINFYQSLEKDELQKLNQGYLLFTYGEKQ